MEFFSKFTILEEVPNNEVHKLKDRCFLIGGKKCFRLIPCNFNAMSVLLLRDVYTTGYANGRALTFLLNTPSVGTDRVGYTNYKFPDLVRGDDAQSRLLDNNQSMDVDYMVTYMKALQLKMDSDLDITESMIRRGKELMLAAFNEFISSDVHELAEKAPFLKDSLNKELFARMMNLGGRYTGYDGQYMFEAKATFMLNVLINSLNLYLHSCDAFESIHALTILLSKMVIKRENCWMLGSVLKLECLKSFDEIVSVFGIITGSANVAYNDIFEIPQKLWLSNLTDPVEDRERGYIKAYDFRRKVIYVMYKTYDDMEDQLTASGEFVLLDIMPINSDTAIFKLSATERIEPAIIRDINVSDAGFKTYIVKTTEHSEYAMMAVSRLRDMLVFVTRLAIFDYDTFMRKEKHAADPTAMQRYFRVLFHRAYISENITNMYDTLFEMMMSYLLKSTDYESDGSEAEAECIRALDSRLNVLATFIDGKLLELGLNRQSNNIDHVLYQLIDIYKYDMLLLL